AFSCAAERSAARAMLRAMPPNTAAWKGATPHHADVPLGDAHTARADSTAATGPAGGSGAGTASPVADGSASTGPAAAGSRGGDGGARG
ncbi:hypothetical protein ACWERV_34410, partial [Streptomyces sp. NPDC004031]